jgi:hypothetical protein
MPIGRLLVALLLSTGCFFAGAPSVHASEGIWAYPPTWGDGSTGTKNAGAIVVGRVTADKIGPMNCPGDDTYCTDEKQWLYLWDDKTPRDKTTLDEQDGTPRDVHSTCMLGGWTYQTFFRQTIVVSSATYYPVFSYTDARYHEQYLYCRDVDIPGGGSGKHYLDILF